MRIKVGQIVDTDAEVNLLDLKPLDRIIASAINAYHNTGMYRRRFAENEERKEEQRRKIRESLIDSVLSVISEQMDKNALLKDRGDECVGMLISVPARFQSFLQDVVTSHEFDAYEVTIIPPSKLLAKYASAPYLLHIANRGG